MPMPTVEHIANVSFKDHFLSAQEAAPKNGSIQELRSPPGGAGETSAAALAGFDVIHV